MNVPQNRTSFGPLSVEGQLTRTSHSIIWRARTPTGEPVAVKELKVQRAGREPYLRLRDEIAFHIAGPHDGVLPVLFYDLPEQPSKITPAWLATPLAQTLAEALGESATLEEVVAAIASCAQTLATLAALNVFHRDLKPANLFALDGKWLVGDFGLVTFPGKEQLTEPGQKLGPANFVAPETIDDAVAAGPGPADVWALAKTLWTLAVGQNWPAPGPLRREDPFTSLRGNVAHPRAFALEPILELATSLDSSARPSMATFAGDLAAWLRGPSPPVAAPDTDDLATRMSILAEPRRRQAQTQDELAAVTVELFNGLRRGPEALSDQMNRLGQVRMQDDGLLLFLGAGSGRRDRIASAAMSWTLGAPNAHTVGLSVEVGYELFGPGLIHLAAGVHLRGGEPNPEVLWSETRQAPPATALATQYATELADLIVTAFPRDAGRYVDLAEAAEALAQAHRQPLLHAAGITYDFRTEPDAGVIAVYRRADGSRDGYATAWLRTPITSIAADGDRLKVRTIEHEGYIERTASAHWVLASSEQIAENGAHN